MAVRKFVAALLMCCATAFSSGTLRFPSVTADSLSKRTLHLPSDFGPGRNLVLIAFDRSQQKDVDTWVAPETALAQSNSTFRFYDVPVMPHRDVLYRWWLNTAMRVGMTDNKELARTVPVYVSKEPFKKALDINNEKTISVILLDSAGNIHWRSSGAWTEEKQRALVYAMGHD